MIFSMDMPVKDFIDYLNNSYETDKAEAEKGDKLFRVTWLSNLCVMAADYAEWYKTQTHSDFLYQGKPGVAYFEDLLEKEKNKPYPSENYSLFFKIVNLPREESFREMVKHTCDGFDVILENPFDAGVRIARKER